jgi:hypothetical protein
MAIHEDPGGGVIWAMACPKTQGIPYQHIQGKVL